MDANEYQKAAMRTTPQRPPTIHLLNAALGLCGEGGEVAEHVKKYHFHDHPLDKAALRKELGDVLWYVALACDALELQLGDVMAENIDKLRRRYPEGFDPDKSRNREGTL